MCKSRLDVAERPSRWRKCSGDLWSEAGPSRGRLLREDSDHVVALRGGHSLSCMLLTVDLILHKEMAFLLEVDVAVRARVALRVAKLVPQLHHHPPEEQRSG